MHAEGLHFSAQQLIFHMHVWFSHSCLCGASGGIDELGMEG